MVKSLAFDFLFAQLQDTATQDVVQPFNVFGFIRFYNDGASAIFRFFHISREALLAIAEPLVDGIDLVFQPGQGEPFGVCQGRNKKPANQRHQAGELRRPISWFVCGMVHIALLRFAHRHDEIGSRWRRAGYFEIASLDADAVTKGKW